MKHAYASEAPTRPAETAGGFPLGEAPEGAQLAAVEAPEHRLRRVSLLEGAGWARLLFAGDTTALILGSAAALIGAPAAHADASGKALIWLFPPLVLAILAARRMYGSRIQVRVVDDLGVVVAAAALAAISLIAGAAILEPDAEPTPLLARAWLFGTVYLAGARLLLAWAQRRARASRLVAKPTLIVGAGRIGARVEHRLRVHPELGLLPVGYLDADPVPQAPVPERRAPVLGSPADLGSVAAATGAEHVVLAFTSEPDRMLIPLVRECEQRGLTMSIVPRLFEAVNVRAGLEHLGGLPLFGLDSIDPKGWQFLVKHALDRAAAAGLLLLLAPLLLVVALAVKLSSRGPVFFRQRRIGRDGRDFDILKFRSMREPKTPAPDPVTLPRLTEVGPGGVEGVDRRTRFGAFLRRTSIDELPQLLNVVKGDMSLVGPRPERPEFVEMFRERIHRYDDRHRVKSGITGWAQVNGLRGKTSVRDRVEWDNFYIENWSLGLDVKILLMTMAALKAAE